MSTSGRRFHVTGWVATLTRRPDLADTEQWFTFAGRADALRAGFIGRSVRPQSFKRRVLKNTMSTNSDQQAINRLVTVAREEGKADSYVGKRRWKRYQLGMPFEVTLDPSVPSGSWRVLTHSISGGGVAFWSKQAFAEGEGLFVREWTDDEPGPWLPARVTYSTLGLNGYLTGMAFDQPSAPDAAHEPVLSTDSEDEPAPAPRPRRSGRRMSLARQCVYACAAGSGFGALSLLFADRLWPGMAPEWVEVLAPVTAFVLGAVLGWALIRREARLLEALRQTAEQLASGKPSNVSLYEAGTREVAGIRQALLDLARRWKQHSEAERTQRDRLAELNQIKTNILSMVSHDLRTPLTSIQLYARMLLDDLNELAEEDQRHFLEIISEECMRLSRLVDDLLEIQRIEAGRVEWSVCSHDLAETIQACARVYAPVADNNEINFEVDCPDSLPPIQADPDKMAQVIGNLLSNAMKFAPAGGRVRLTADVRNREIVLCVSDNGPGIPREKWDFIFDRFSQISSNNVREIAGAGLGLSIVRQIVERHHGKVWVDSEVGRGARFCVALPLDCPEGEPVGVTTEGASAGSVVVCDADPDLTASMARILRHHRFDVRTAHSGVRLMEHLAQTAPDVVVSDIMLPDMTALEFFDTMHRMKPRSFSLVVHSYESDDQDLKRRGVDGLLTRPASPEEIVESVRVAMHRRRGLGSIVVLIESRMLDIERLSERLTAAGHLTLIAPECRTAAKWVRAHSIDYVLINAEAFTFCSEGLDELMDSVAGPTRVIALGPHAGRRDRQFLDDRDVTPLSYRSGEEDEVVASITASRGEAEPELIA